MQITFNHAPDMGFQGFINLYRKCATKPYSFLVIDTTLASDISLPFRCNRLEIIKKAVGIIHGNIRYEKRKYTINKVAAKILELSSGKINKY